MMQNTDSFVISSNLSQLDLKIFSDFVMKGILPCPEIDIMSGKLPSEINNMFLSFGINLNYILMSFKIKMEGGVNIDIDTQLAKKEPLGKIFRNFLFKCSVNFCPVLFDLLKILRGLNN